MTSQQRSERADLWSHLQQQRQHQQQQANTPANNDENSNPVAKPAETLESTILLLGAPCSGKTTILYSTLNVTAAVKPTTGLAYKAVTREAQSISKDSKAAAANKRRTTSHWWELAASATPPASAAAAPSATLAHKLIPFAITADSIGSTLVTITVDLTARATCLTDLQSYLDIVLHHSDEVLKQLKAHPQSSQQAHALTNKQLQRIVAAATSQQHPDLPVAGSKKSSTIKVSPVSIIVLATKLDAVLNTVDGTAYLHAVSKPLRAICHSVGASLLFTDKSSAPSISMYKALTSRHINDTYSNKLHSVLAFNAEPTSLQQPLCVVAGQDSFESIGEPPQSQGRGNAVQSWVNWYQQTYAANADVPAASNDFKLAPEQTLDAVLRQREEELNRLAGERALQKKHRLATATNMAPSRPIAGNMVKVR